MSEQNLFSGRELKRARCKSYAICKDCDEIDFDRRLIRFVLEGSKG